MTYALCRFGSLQVALRLPKLAPVYGTVPSEFTTYFIGPGPFCNWNRCRGSPVGCRIFKAPAYSSKPPVPALSTVMMPNEERNTHFGMKFHAKPRRGWKLFKSRLPIAPFGCVIAPILPVTGSTAAGSNCDCWSYLVL